MGYTKEIVHRRPTSEIKKYQGKKPDGLDAMSDEKDRLTKYLSSNQGVFFTAKNLAKTTGFETTGTCRGLRRAIKELVEEEQRPIISTDSGFAWAEHPNQLLRYIERLEERRDGLQRRIEGVRQAYTKMRGTVE